LRAICSYTTGTVRLLSGKTVGNRRPAAEFGTQGSLAVQGGSGESTRDAGSPAFVGPGRRPCAGGISAAAPARSVGSRDPLLAALRPAAGLHDRRRHRLHQLTRPRV